MSGQPSIAEPKTRKPRFFYGYVVVAASFLIMAMTWGSLYTFGVFFKSFLSEFNWTRAATAGAFSLAAIFIGAGSIVCGRFTDRVGPRRVVTVCSAFLALGFVLLSQVQALWHLYLYYGLVGVGVSGAFVPMVSTVARWFVKRRGLMTGITVSGLGVGTLVMPPLATWLISVFEWRNAYVIISVLVFVLIMLAAQFLRRDPQEMGLLPYGENKSNAFPYSAANGFTLLEALATRQFWTLSAIYLFYCLSIGAVIAHIVLHGIGLGASPAKAAVILSVTGAASTAGRIILGTTGDRVGYKRTLAIALAVQSAALFWLLAARDLWMLYLFGVAFGFSYGGIAALFSPFIAEQFGLKAHGIILGVFMIASQIGEAVSPVITGHIFDRTGSYFLAFLAWAVLAAVSLILVLILRPPWKKPV